MFLFGKTFQLSDKGKVSYTADGQCLELHLTRTW